MSKQISFIHAADLHLDSPFKGLANTPEEIFKEIQKSTFVALEGLVSAAIQKEVDFVLLVGDLFDNEKQSLKAQIQLRRAFDQLNEHQINVYLSYGNHDHINGNVYPVTYPDNVYIFPSEEVSQFTYEKDGESLVDIHGFSYEYQAIKTNKAKEYKVTNKGTPFQIAMLHGSIQSNKEHDLYAPFQISDLVEKNFDYWALGHIHKREILKETPRVVYPGNTQGRHRKETGIKGCYHVILTETKCEMNFIPLHAIQFTPLTIDVTECEEVHQIEQMIQKVIEDKTNVATPLLIDLRLRSDTEELTNWKNEGYLEEVTELINETTTLEKNWIYIFRLSVEIHKTNLDNEILTSDHFIGELARQFQDKSIEPFAKELYNHRQGRKFLERLTDEDVEQIKADAKQMLLNGLINNEG